MLVIYACPCVDKSELYFFCVKISIMIFESLKTSAGIASRNVLTGFSFYPAFFMNNSSTCPGQVLIQLFIR